MGDDVLEAFRRFDGNGEGCISRDALCSLFHDLRTDWTDARSAQLLAAASLDSATVDYDQLIRWIFANNGDRKSPSCSATSNDDCTNESLMLGPRINQCPNLTDLCLVQEVSTAMDAHEASAEEERTTWEPGALVDRLVDDFTNIWAGAVVQAVHAGNLYDILYVDTGLVEEDVEGDELRSRRMPFQFNQELWEHITHFVSDGMLLSAVQQVERASNCAVIRHHQRLWSVLYHCNFGKCGARCSLKRSIGKGTDVAEAVAAAEECARVSADPCLSPLEKQRRPWKTRYVERHLDIQFEKVQSRLADSTGEVLNGMHSPNRRSPNDNLDGRLRFGRDALRGSVFDPMLGRMVSEDGGSAGRVLISRGKNWYSH